jgi:hypothetical protein
MTIRFKCPNAKCQKALVVKDEQAGKRLRCPACKQPVSVPAPVSAPVDLEAFAAAALADEPAEKKPAASAAAPKQAQTIDFACYYCEAELHIPAEEAGKQVPCPECRKIIKVPQLKVEKAKDWRDVEKKGPSFAKQDAPEKPVGAWDTTRTRVGEDALEEAGVITEPQEPRTLKERLKWPLIGVSAVILVALLWYVSASLMSQSAQRRALNAALAYVEPKEGTTKLFPPLAAEVFRAAGEFHLRAGQAVKARGAFAKARQCLQIEDKESKDKATGLDRDLLLTEIAISQTGLGGAGAEVLGRGDDQERLEWQDAGTEILQTLRDIASDEAQAAALEEVGRRLLERGQPDVAIGLASQLNPNAAAGEEKAVKPPVLARLVALLLATGKAEEAAKLLPPPGKDQRIDPLARIAYAQGKALQGDVGGAYAEAKKKGAAPARLRALLAVAAVALGQGKGDVAKAGLADALRIEEELKKDKAIKLDAFLTLQLARLAARTGAADKAFADGKADKSARARVHLESLLAELAKLKESGTPAEPKLVDELVKEKDTLAYALGQEAVARHNARLGRQSEVLDYLESLEERFRPFAQIGIALGIQDREKQR